MSIRKFANFSWGNLNIEFGDGFNAYGIGIRFFGEDNTVQLALHLHWALYLGIDWYWLNKIVKEYEWGYRLGAHVSGRYLTIDFFNKDDRSTLFWDWWEYITGKPKYSTKTLSSGPCEVILPENRYQAVYSVNRRSWNYPRWFVTEQMDSIMIEVEKGIPVPGKGENSHDQGDDAIYSVSSPVDYDSDDYSLKKALDDLAMTVLRRRQRYASLDWLPSQPEVEDIIHEHKRAKQVEGNMNSGSSRGLNNLR